MLALLQQYLGLRDRVDGTALPAVLTLFAFVLMFSLSTPARANDTDQVKQQFEERFPGVVVDEVFTTPFGLYEVQIDETLVYTNASVDWVLEGVLIDAVDRRNLTAARQEQLNAVPFGELPLELAFVQVKGDGSRHIAIFEDPNCPYCKQLRRTLEDIDNLTIHTFLYPILSPDSRAKTEAVWCAEDKVAAWEAWMLRDEEPAAAACDAPIDEFINAGQQLRVRGTPTIFFQDGSRVSGALPRPLLEQRLARAAR